MSLRNRIRLLGLALAVVLWTGVWFGHPDNLGGTWVLLSVFVVVLVGIAVANVLARRSLSRFRKALSVGDIPAAKKEHADLADFWRRRGRETIRAYGVNILLLEERYQEALNQLGALDAKKLGKTGDPVIQNHIAYCKAMLGEPTKALEISKGVLPRLEAMGQDYSASGNLVMGIANFLSGQSSEAVPYLRKAYTASACIPTRKTIAAFYLGEAFSALGKSADAREAYQHARDDLPNGRFAIRASERLK